MTDKNYKLIRNRIPEIIEASGQKATIRIADDVEYPVLLRQKLLEEVNEFLESGAPEELADIIEVVFSLAETYGISLAGLLNMAEKKREERGGFNKKIVLIMKAQTDPE